MPQIELKLPRSPTQRARMVEVIKALSPRAKQELFQEADEWAETAEDGRVVLGVLNRRYDLCVLKCDRPAPWFAAAFDTQTRELILAHESRNGRRIDRATCARYCAEALNEAIETVEP